MFWHCKICQFERLFGGVGVYFIHFTAKFQVLPQLPWYHCRAGTLGYMMIYTYVSLLRSVESRSSWNQKTLKNDFLPQRGIKSSKKNTKNATVYFLAAKRFVNGRYKGTWKSYFGWCVGVHGVISAHVLKYY